MPTAPSAPSRFSARQVLAANMRRLRAELQWTQEELAFRSGIDRSFLAHVERSARNVSIDVIERIAIALSVSVQELFREDVCEAVT